MDAEFFSARRTCWLTIDSTVQATPSAWHYGWERAMLDAGYIRENLDAVKANCVNRKVTADVDRVVTLDDERKRLAQQTQHVQQRQNELSKLIPKEKEPSRKQELIAEGKTLGDTTTLADPAVVARLKNEYESVES